MAEKLEKPQPKDKTTQKYGLLFRRKIGFGPIAAILMTLIAYFGSQLFAGVLIGLYASGRGYSQDKISDLIQNSIPWQFAFILIVEVFTLLILWWFMKYRTIKWSDIGLGRKPVWSDLGYGIITYGLYFLALMVTFGILSQVAPSLNFDQKQQLGFEGATGGVSLVLVFISLVLLPAIVEEIMVRGFLFSGLKKGMKVGVAAVVASLIFGAAHLQLGSGAPPLWIAAIDTFLLSIVLIILRLRTGSIWAGMITHAVKNGLAFIALFVLVAN